MKTEIKVDTKTGNASAELSSRQLESGGDFMVVMPEIPGVTEYALNLPAANLSGSDGQGSVTLNTAFGGVTLPADMLSGIETVPGTRAQFAMGTVDAGELPEAARWAVGSRPVVQLTLTVDGKRVEWNNPNAPVAVSIPYTPTAEELKNPECILVWYIDGSGKAVSVPNGRYDAESGTVTFTATHFSYYAVGYNRIPYTDVHENAWYHRAISFISARGVTSGTGNGKFSPEANLTRGQFITLLLKAYGIEAEESSANNFSDAGSAYYTGYLAAAKRLGISSGTGDNMFSPNNEITRQEMFTMLYRTLKAIGKLPGELDGYSDKTISDFTDNAQIAPYAKEAMEYLVKTGIVNGNGGQLVPEGKSTRAQMAQVLYNLMT